LAVRKISDLRRYGILGFLGYLESQLRFLVASNGLGEIQVLDVGGGYGILWQEILERNPRIRLTIIDPLHVSSDKDPAHERIQSTFLESSERFAPDSFDVVTAIDLLEHLPKHDGYAFLYEMERIAKRHVVIYTPNGFVWQPPSLNNPFNAHLSSWSVDDLRNFGFRSVKGHIGLKVLFGPYAERRKGVALPRPFEPVLIALSSILAYVFPKLAFAISGWLQADARIAVNQSR
jgi:hypothetical protein